MGGRAILSDATWRPQFDRPDRSTAFFDSQKCSRRKQPTGNGLWPVPASLDGSIDCIGLAALQAIAADGPSRMIRGVGPVISPCPSCHVPWPVHEVRTRSHQITSAAWSPRLKANIGLSLIDPRLAGSRTQLPYIFPMAACRACGLHRCRIIRFANRDHPAGAIKASRQSGNLSLPQETACGIWKSCCNHL